MDKISGATIIRNNYAGAFCLYESMASIMPFVDDMVVLDLDSDDGTLQTLQQIADANPKVRVISTHYSCIDARAFADAANDGIAAWKYDQGIFWQADEVWHEYLLTMLEEELDAGHYDLTFWRYQLRDNWQRMGWPPHIVHRVGMKDNFTFIGDGMNSDRYGEPPLVSHYDDKDMLLRWGEEFQADYTKVPTHEMVMDVSHGGFFDNMFARRSLHAPMWHESVVVDGESYQQWYDREVNNPGWLAETTPFDIPGIMKWHVGRKQYEVREELLEALMADDTRRILGL